MRIKGRAQVWHLCLPIDSFCYNEPSYRVIIRPIPHLAGFSQHEILQKTCPLFTPHDPPNPNLLNWWSLMCTTNWLLVLPCFSPYLFLAIQFVERGGTFFFRNWWCPGKDDYNVQNQLHDLSFCLKAGFNVCEEKPVFFLHLCAERKEKKREDSAGSDDIASMIKDLFVRKKKKKRLRWQ